MNNLYFMYITGADKRDKYFDFKVYGQDAVRRLPSKRGA